MKRLRGAHARDVIDSAWTRYWYIIDLASIRARGNAASQRCAFLRGIHIRPIRRVCADAVFAERKGERGRRHSSCLSEGDEKLIRRVRPDARVLHESVFARGFDEEIWGEALESLWKHGKLAIFAAGRVDLNEDFFVKFFDCGKHFWCYTDGTQFRSYIVSVTFNV